MRGVSAENMSRHLGGRSTGKYNSSISDQIRYSDIISIYLDLN